MTASVKTSAALRRAAVALRARFADARRPGVEVVYATLNSAVQDGRDPGDWPTIELASCYQAVKGHLGIPRFGTAGVAQLRGWLLDHTVADVVAMLNATADEIEEDE